MRMVTVMKIKKEGGKENQNLEEGKEKMQDKRKMKKKQKKETKRHDREDEDMKGKEIEKMGKIRMMAGRNVHY